MDEIRQMWKELGLDLEKHDQLLSSLNLLHERTHLSQKNRPQAMARFDHSFHASHAERVKEIKESITLAIRDRLPNVVV